MKHTPMQQVVLNRQLNAQQRGATLIEVLVAIFLLTVGLLAMAALTGTATSYNKLSQIRGTATMLANDYADQARSNLRAFDVGYYAVSTAYVSAQPSTALPDTTASYASPGGLAEAKLVANWDRYNWMLNVARRLPSGKAIVTTTTAAAGSSDARMMEIWLEWKEPSTAFAVPGTSEFAKCHPSETDTAYSCLYFKVAI
jgi:type IV pilus assembly protein PilV